MLKFKKTIISLSSIVLLLILAVGFLLSTNTGLKWTIGLINFVTPIEIHYQNLQGTLLKDIKANSVTVKDQNFSAQITQLNLSWQVESLLKKQLTITNLTAKQLIVQYKTTKSEKESGKFQFNLPININLKQLKIDNIEIKPDNQKAFKLNKLNLSLVATKKIANINLTVNTLSGTITTKGSLTLTPTLKWQATLDFKHINPGEYFTNFNGAINATIKTSGSYDKVLQAKAQLQNFSGELRGYQITGLASISINNRQINIEKSEIKIGDALLSVSGKIANKWQLSWLVDIPDLKTLLPGATGLIKSSGQITGERKTPKIKFNVSANAVGFKQISLANLNADGFIDLADFDKSDVDLTANDINYQGHAINTVQFDLQGIEQQKLTLNIKAPDYSLQLATISKFENQTITGNIEQLKLSISKDGVWLLKNKPKFSFKKNSIDIQNFCLARGKEQICGQFSFDKPDKINATLTTKNLNLSIINPILAKDMKIDAPFSLNLTVNTQGKKYIAKALMKINPGIIESTNKTIKTINFKGGEINFNLTNQGLVSNIDLALQASQTIKGQIIFPGLINQNLDLKKQTIEGNIKIDLPSLNFLNAFFQDVKNIKGSLTANLNFSQKLLDPKIEGTAKIKNGSLEIESLGISPKNITLTFSGNQSGVVKIQGQLQSGKGILTINGESQLLKKGMPTTVRATGSNVEILNTKDASITVSPDLSIQLEGNKIEMKGKINVNHAKITPEDFGSTVTLPEEVIIINGSRQEHKEAAILFYSDIKINLNDKVYFAYQGISAQIGGSLHIQDAPKQPIIAFGELRILKGAYQAYGQDLTIYSGKLTFVGGPIDNPNLNLTAGRTVKVVSNGGVAENVQVGVRVTGMLAKPILTLYSTPISLEQSQILSYLLFGRSAQSLSESQGKSVVQAATALNIIGHELGFKEHGLGLDELGIQTDPVYDPATGGYTENTSLVLGKQISKKVFVSYGIGLLQPINTFRAKYQLNRHWSVQGESAGGDSGVDLLYTFER